MGNNIPVPDKSVKKDYELESYELESVDGIRNRLQKGRLRDSEEIKDSLDYVEKLINKIELALKNEQEAGYDNLTLKEKKKELSVLFKMLEAKTFK